MNITFILGSTFNTGGMERMLTTIANATAQLQDENGYTYHVTALSAFNEGRKDFFPFINAVTRVDLGIMLKGGGG